MKITAANLIRWAGLSAMVAGISFVVVGLLHPPQVLSSVTTGTWLVVHLLTIAVTFFGLLGIASCTLGKWKRPVGLVWPASSSLASSWCWFPALRFSKL